MTHRPSPLQPLVGPLLALALAAGCRTASPVHAPEPAARPPRTVVLRAENLAWARDRVRAGDASVRPAYDRLLRDADAALRLAPPTVMQKRRTPSSGDKHDFMSTAPYWWPDSTRPGGLPYVRRDGERNPESREDSDDDRFNAMESAVYSLALAYHLGGDERYARGAATLLRAWFLDPATRMNPNLRFAQAVPGVSEGRSFGIIETHNMTELVDAVALLRGSASWTDADQRGLVDWERAFLRWLRTDTLALEERAAPNNHGSWYDAQTAAVALFVGDTAVVREIVGRSARARVASQIRPDGSQPEELARTRSLSYSLFNLEALARLAEIGRHVGVDLWGYEAPGGGSLRRALAYLAPYADPARKWEGQQLTPVSPSEMLVALRRAVNATGDATLAAALARIPESATRADRARLLYADRPATAQATARTPLDTLVDHALRFAAARLARTADSLDPAKGYPRLTRPDGTWEVKGATQWTGGFFPGQLWYMYELTRDPVWRARAERWTAPLEVMKNVTTTHDLGFVVFPSFGHGYLLTNDPHDEQVVLDASRTLVRRFNPAVGAIKSWDTERQSDRRKAWEFPVIIDNLMNLEMLFWAGGRPGGDPAWRSVAERHALTSLRAHVRDDGSTAHVALFDPRSGAFRERVTWQGYADTSVWARGQAWAIYGFTVASRETGRPELLAGARRTADWFLAHLPADQVPYWDFRDPGIPSTVRDASAAAIAASGLFELSSRVGGRDGARYRAAAERILESLCTRYTTEGTSSWALLQHATGGRPQNVEIDVGLTYADYYFVEALLRYRKARGL